MKKLLLFLLLLLAGNIFAQEPTDNQCGKFRTGSFHYGKTMPGVTIERDSLYQTEIDADGKYIKMSITWTSPCTYELRLLKTNSRKHKKAWKKMGVLVVTITSVDENSYRYSAVSPALSQPVRGTIYRK